MQKKYLIVGSTGFLGSNLLKLLEEKNEDVYTLDRNPRLKKSYSYRDMNTMEKNFDIVFHLAAIIPSKNNLESVTENISIASLVVENFSQSKIIYSSSVSVYYPNDKIIDEDDKVEPINEYGIAKLEAEYIIKKCKNYNILRFSSLYGPDMRLNTFLKRIIEDAYYNQYIHLYDSNRLQDYLYILDAVNILYESTKFKENGIFNAVHGSSVKNIEIADIVKKYLPNINIYIENTITNSYRYSNQKWDSIFGNQYISKQFTNIDEGIFNMIKKYKNQT